MKKMLYSIILCYLILNSTFFNSSKSFANYVWSSEQMLSIATSSYISKENTNDSINSLNLNCESYILIEQHSGKVLTSYNCHKQLKPASVTKLMSILLIMESIDSGKINYDTSIPCSENASHMGGSQIWLDTTEILTVEEMLKAICVVSANDCVMAMAEYISGTEENFVKLMNEKAKTLGMNDTFFKNCHGIDEDGHVTSSYDISLMSKELLNKYPEITKYTTIWNDSLRNGKSELINTNKLVRNYSGCTGLKTGSTSQALFNLSASATRDNLSLIAVIMKAPTSTIRFKNASTLLDFGFSNFEYKTLSQEGDFVQSIPISKGIESSINIVYESTMGTIVEKGNSININQTLSINNNITAPIKKGDILGNVNFSLNNESIYTVNLIAEKDISKTNFFTVSTNLIKKWLNIIR